MGGGRPGLAQRFKMVQNQIERGSISEHGLYQNCRGGCNWGEEIPGRKLFFFLLKLVSGRAFREGTKVTVRAQNADFHRKPQIFADATPISWKFKHLEGAGNLRKPQIFAGHPRFSQIAAGNRRLGSVTLGASPIARPYIYGMFLDFGAPKSPKTT